MVKRLLITGARGLVGKSVKGVIASKYSEDFEVLDFLDAETGSSIDIRDRGAVERAIERADADCVLHLAAVAAPRQARQNLTAAWEINVLGTLNVANAIMQFSRSTRMIWSGSSEAYGDAFNKGVLPLSEEAALEPLTPYGATKAAGDMMLRQMMQDGLDAVVFRPFNHTGAGQTADYVVPAFAEQIAKIEAGLQPPTIKVGNLEAKRDFLDVSDVAEAYLAAARGTSLSGNKVFNISTGKPVSIKEILQALLDMSSTAIEVEVDPERYVANSVETASGDYSALNNALGWSPTVPLEETLRAVLDEKRSAN